MGTLVIPAKSWLLLCDGSKALIFQNQGDAQNLNLQLRQSKSQPGEPTHHIGTERPGRSFSSIGKGRSAVETPDWHDIAEQEFLKDVAQDMEEIVRAQAVHDLVIAAPARAMGVLRTCLGPGTRAVLRAEINKDLCKMPTPEIEAYLTAMRENA